MAVRDVEEHIDKALLGQAAISKAADLHIEVSALGSDDEPLDALVLTIESAYPGVRVRARPNRGGLGQWSTG